MEIINIHDAKTNLSRLLEEVQKGKPFIIAKSGRPIARVTRFEAPASSQMKRVGFLSGQIEVPDDFDRMGEDEVLSMFGEDDAPAS